MTLKAAIRVSALAVLWAAGFVRAAGAEPAVWTLVPGQSSLEFVFEQAGSDERGRFEDFDAEFRFDPRQPGGGGFSATIDMASVETGDAERDNILRSADLFAVERWPESSFKTLSIEEVGEGCYEAEAELTIRDRTRTLPFPFELRFSGQGAEQVLHLTAEVTLERLRYGVGQGDWAETKWVPNEVRVLVDVKAARAAATE